MSSDKAKDILKEDLGRYLDELAKEFKKEAGGRARAELILVGGGSVLANYSFRNMTTDLDAEIQTEASMKAAINRVGDRNGLPNGWLNTDFIKSESYSTKLRQVSRYYATFRQVLEVRTVRAEYLVAMKLKSGRIYKHDLSDVIGILMEHKEKKDPISRESVERAFAELYGDGAKMEEVSAALLNRVFEDLDLGSLYQEAASHEKMYRDILIDFDRKYPGTIKKETVNDMLIELKKRRARGTER